MAKHYVLYYYERLRDGSEEGAKVFSSVESALATAARWKKGPNPHNTEVRLFELGEEIPLVEEKVEEPQPAKTATRFRLKMPPPEPETGNPVG